MANAAQPPGPPPAGDVPPDELRALLGNLSDVDDDDLLPPVPAPTEATEEAETLADELDAGDFDDDEEAFFAAPEVDGVLEVEPDEVDEERDATDTEASALSEFESDAMVPDGPDAEVPAAELADVDSGPEGFEIDNSEGDAPAESLEAALSSVEVSDAGEVEAGAPAEASADGDDADEDSPSALPELPRPRRGDGAASGGPSATDPHEIMEWQNAIQGYESEINALASDDPRRALLYYEVGRIWDDILGNKRNAGANYQKAFQLNRRLVPNIRAARRLFEQAARTNASNWKMVLQLLEAELAVQENPRERAALLVEKRAIHFAHLDQKTEGRAALEAAIDLEPANLSYLKLLERTLTEAGDWRGLYDGYGRALEEGSGAYADAEPTVRADLLSAQARVAEEQLGDPSDALELYKKAYDADPRNQAASQALKRLLARFHQWESLASVYEEEAQSLRADAPEAAVLPYYLAARVCVEYLDSEGRAVELLMSALEIAPDDVLVLGELASIHEQKNDWESLARTYSRMVELVSDERELVTLFYKLGELWAEHLYNDEQAINHFQRVVELDPHYLPAQQALGRLFRKQGRWEDLAGMFRVEAESIAFEGGDDALRVVKLFKRAEILEEHLERDEEAIEGYREVLELRADYLPALKALGRLYGKHGRFGELVEMHERELDATEDNEQSIALLSRIGNLCEDRLGDLDRAIDAWRRVRERQPEHLPTIRNLGRLFAKAGRWRELVEVNEEEIQRLDDDRRAVALLHKNGELYEEHLTDRDAAIQCYERALERNASYVPALKALGQLYHQRGLWQQLVEMYQRELEAVASEGQRVTLLYKVGEVYEIRLLDEHEALSWYERALEVRPDYGPATKALIRIHTDRRDWGALVALYRREYERADDIQQKVSLAYRIADIYEDKMRQPEEAVQMYKQALALDDGYLPTIRALIRLYTALEQWDALLEVYGLEIRVLRDADKGTPRHEVDLRLRMAEVCSQRLQDHEQAVSCYEAVLNIAPDHVPALRALEKHYRVRGEFVKLQTVYERLAACATDQQERVYLHLEMATLKERHLQGWGEDDGTSDPADDYLAVLALDPANPRALNAMEDLYRRSGDWEGLVALLERRKTLTESPARQLELAMAIADMAERRLNDTPKAVDAYDDALRLDPRYLPAIRSLKRIYQNAGNWPKLTELLEAEGQSAADGAQAVAALYQAGTLREGFGDVERAVDDYTRVLNLDPANGPAFNRMEALMRKEGRWESLIAAHTRRLEVAPGPQARAQTQLSIGRIYECELEDLDNAVRAYLKALNERPDHLATMEALGGVYFQRERWDEAMSTYNRIIELSMGRPQMKAKDLAPVHMKLGEIFVHHRRDVTRARTHLEAVLSVQPDHLEALQAASTVYLEGEIWDRAADVLRRLISVLESAEPAADPELLVQNNLSLARVLDAGFSDAMGASQHYRAALELRPDCTEATEALTHLYEKLRDWPRLLEVFAGLIDTLRREEPEKAVPLILQRARIYDAEMGQAEKAAVEYRRALDAQPDNVDARRTLAALYARDSASHGSALEEYRRLVQRDPVDLEAYKGMYDIFKAQARHDRAFVLADILVNFGGASESVEGFWQGLRAKLPAEVPGSLEPEENRRLLAHPGERGFLGELFAAIGDDLCRGWPVDLDPWGVSKGDRLGARSDASARRIVDAVGAALGANAGSYDVYVSEREPKALSLVAAVNNAAIVMGNQTRVQDRRELRARLAPLVQRIASGETVVSLVDDKELHLLVYAVVRMFDSDVVPAPLPGGVLRGDEIEDMGKRVAKALTRKSRRAAEELVLRHLQNGKVPDIVQWSESAQLSGDRATLALTGDLTIALRQALLRDRRVGNLPWGDPRGLREVIEGSRGAIELLSFAVSEEYFTVRERLRMAVV